MVRNTSVPLIANQLNELHCKAESIYHQVTLRGTEQQKLTPLIYFFTAVVVVARSGRFLSWIFASTRSKMTASSLSTTSTGEAAIIYRHLHIIGLVLKTLCVNHRHRVDVICANFSYVLDQLRHIGFIHTFSGKQCNHCPVCRCWFGIRVAFAIYLLANVINCGTVWIAAGEQGIEVFSHSKLVPRLSSLECRHAKKRRNARVITKI